MTQRFILDENVVIFAEKGEDDSGDRDLTCLELITRIIRICHTLVLDSRLWGKYQSQLSDLTSSDAQVSVRVLPMLVNAFRRVGKIDLKPNAPPFPEEESIPAGSQDDVEIVRLAVETGATLVTTDRPLKNDLNSCGVMETHGLRLLSPNEALQRL